MLASPLTRRMPTPLSELSAGFLENNGRPAFMAMPCDGPEAKAYDLSGSGSPEGTLNGGITTTPGGFGTLGAAWNRKSSSTYIDVGKPISLGKPFWVFTVFSPTASLTTLSRFLIEDDGTNGFGLTIAVANAPRFFCRGLSTVATDVSSLAIATGKWYFQGGGWDGSTAFSVCAQLGSALLSASQSVSGTPTNPSVDFQIGGSTTGFLDNWQGYIAIGGAFQGKPTLSQFNLLYNCLLTGEPYPLFQPTIMDRWGGLSAAGGGAFQAAWASRASETLCGGMAA